MIKAVIFDMDGVLIDSGASAIRVRKRVLAQYDVDFDDLPDPHGERFIPASNKNLLAVVKSHTGVHIDHDEYSAQTVEHMRKDLLENGVSADPALIPFLKDLKKHNLKCAITTSSLRNSVINKLNILGIEEYFDLIVTGSDVKEHKPHPEGYEYTMERLNLMPDECVIIEDSQVGIDAGCAAGCRVVGFTLYNTFPKPLTGTVAIVTHWNELTYHKLDSWLKK